MQMMLASFVAPESLWNIDDAAYNSQSFDTSTQSNMTPSSMAVLSDGSGFLISSTGTFDGILQYTFGATNSLSGTAYASKQLGSLSETTVSGIYLKPDDSQLFIIGVGERVKRITMSTPGDISTGSEDAGWTIINSQGTSMRGISVNDDGTKFYTLNAATRDIVQWTADAFDHTTLVDSGKSFVLPVANTDPGDFQISSDGKQLAVTDLTTDTLLLFSFGTPFDISTVNSTPDSTFDISSEAATSEAIAWGSDNQKVFIGSQGSEIIFEYNSRG